MSCNNIFDHGAVAFSNNGPLQVLNMSQNEISDSGIIAIGKALQDNTSLKIFDISDNKYHLDLNLHFTSLDLPKLHCGAAGAILISAFLHHNKHIQILDISHCDISDDGAIAIREFESIKSNSTLQQINVTQ